MIRARGIQSVSSPSIRCPTTSKGLNVSGPSVPRTHCSERLPRSSFTVAGVRPRISMAAGSSKFMSCCLLALTLSAWGCAVQSAPAPVVLPFAVDTSRVQRVAPGVTHRFVYSRTGPWAIHVLDVALDRCYSALAIKGVSGAIGRAKTSVLLRNLAQAHDVIGGVNADFFLFAPPGVPTGAFIRAGRVVTGPSERPVLAITPDGKPTITTLRVAGSVEIGTRRFPIAAWN